MFGSVPTEGFYETGAPYIPIVVQHMRNGSTVFDNISVKGYYHFRQIKNPDDIDRHIGPMFERFSILDGKQLRKVVPVSDGMDTRDALIHLDADVTYRCGCGGGSLEPVSIRTWYVFFEDPFEEYPWSDFEPYFEGELSKSKTTVSSDYFIARLFSSVPEKYSRAVLAHYDTKQTKLDQFGLKQILI